MSDISNVNLMELPIVDDGDGGHFHLNIGGIDYRFPVNLLLLLNATYTEVQQKTIRDQLGAVDLDDVMTALSQYINYGSPLIGSLIYWPLEKMPHEIFTDMTMRFIPYINQAFDGEAFPLLAKIHPSLKLPTDMRGEVARGWDNGKGVDTGRVLMSPQMGSIVPGDNGSTAETPFTINNIANQQWNYDPIDGSIDKSQLLTINVNNTHDSTNAQIIAPGSPGYVGSYVANTSIIAFGGMTRMRNVAWNTIVRAK